MNISTAQGLTWSDQFNQMWSGFARFKVHCIRVPKKKKYIRLKPSCSLVSSVWAEAIYKCAWTCKFPSKPLCKFVQSLWVLFCILTFISCTTARAEAFLMHSENFHLCCIYSKKIFLWSALVASLDHWSGPFQLPLFLFLVDQNISQMKFPQLRKIQWLKLSFGHS